MHKSRSESRRYRPLQMSSSVRGDLQDIIKINYISLSAAERIFKYNVIFRSVESRNRHTVMSTVYPIIAASSTTHISNAKDETQRLCRLIYKFDDYRSVPRDLRKWPSARSHV